jgi:POT family proton-dependent oligopeptide transporter
VLQYYIYQTSPFGCNANSCDTPAPINFGMQMGAFVLVAISQIFGSVTSLEYAYSKAPKNMRSLVQAVALFTNAFAAAIGEGFVALSDDPLLIWNYAVPAILATIGGCLFWLQFRGLDAEEDFLNMLPAGHVVSSEKPDIAAYEKRDAEEKQVVETIEMDEKRAL